MTDESAPKRLDQAIRNEITKLLSSHKIYKLGSHGWVGPDEMDPEAIGHAMWQLDDPADAVLMREWDSRHIPLAIPEWRALCSVAGADFEGLMNGARMSIGLALFQLERVNERLDDDDSLAAVHSRAAIAALGSASDRIRDYFIAGVFRMGPREYVTQDQSRSSQQSRFQYVGPFNEAALVFADVEQVRQELATLRDTSLKVHNFRLLRNFSVHQVATELGRLRQHVIEIAASPPGNPDQWEKLTDLDFAAIKANAEAEERENKRQAVGMPMEWYRLLIDVARDVFYVENCLRRLRP